MSLWVRLLVFLTFSIFAGPAFFLLINGERKAALGAGVLAALVSPLLVDAIWPGRYVLRRPDGDLEDNLRNRMTQFRIDHPGRDGTLIIGMISLLKIVILAGFVVQLVRAFN
jgi:hypothetical protein